jgi:hypothetical protein
VVVAVTPFSTKRRRAVSSINCLVWLAFLDIVITHSPIYPFIKSWLDPCQAFF